MIEETGQEALQFLNKVAEILPLILYVYDVRQDKVIFSNRLADILMGENNAGLYLADGFFFSRLHNSDRNAFLEFIAQSKLAKDHEQIEVEYRLRQNENEWCWHHQRAIVFTRAEDGSARLILNLTEDITERRHNEETLQRFSTALKMTTDSVIITNLSNKILDANDAAVKLYGFSKKEEFIGLDWFDFIIPADKHIATEGMQTVLINGSLRGKELNIHTRDGIAVPTEVSISIIANAGRAFVGLVIITRDITERKKTEEKLRYISSFDALTRVHNRFSFQGKLMELENGNIAPISVLMMDADGLKTINDTLGHSVGDEYLIAIADILRNSFRQNDFIARIGGDEFVVLLPGTSIQDLANALQRVRNNIEQENRTQSRPFTISVSIGDYTAEKSDQIRQSLFYADERMYEEKTLKKQNKNESWARNDS